MLLRCALIWCFTVSRITGYENTTFTLTEPDVEIATHENLSTPQDVDPFSATSLPESSFSKGSLRPSRGKRKRFRGYYNDNRYRNPENNPYNPHSPYAFRGRVAQQPLRPRAYYDPRYRNYDTQYYNPYNQGYYYQGYQHPGYYPYPYPQPPPQPQPQPVPPVPPTPSTEKNPELFYLQKADSADGHYRYKKVKVNQDNWEGRSRRSRVTQWPQTGYAQGYYGYSYDPYNAVPPFPPQQYYPQAPQQYQYPQPQQQQWGYYYRYPKVPGGPRSRLRTGKPPQRSTASIVGWRLTSKPSPDTNVQESQVTEVGEH